MLDPTYMQGLFMRLICRVPHFYDDVELDFNAIQEQ